MCDTGGKIMKNKEIKHKDCQALGNCEVCYIPVCPDCGTTTDQGELIHYGKCLKNFKGGK
jgi:hypothetical protein